MRSESVENVTGFIDLVSRLRSEFGFQKDDPWGPWYRGNQKASWALLPKLYRGMYGDAARRRKDRVEDEIREEFIVRGPVYSEMSPANNNEWEWYFLMQHFGAPTRLLDWTESALVALYFSVRENPGCYDAAVWVLDPYQMNRKAIGKEEIIAPSVIGLLGKDVKLVEPWLPTRFARKKLPRLPVAVYPAHIARRISTQRSCFTVHGENLDGFDGLRQGKNNAWSRSLSRPMPFRI
jgi:hypothetical protein